MSREIPPCIRPNPCYRRQGFEVVGERMEAGIPHIRMEKLLRPDG